MMNAVNYSPLKSPFGTLWLHRCAALNRGPEWARRERLVIDAGSKDSRLTYRGRSIPFHGHLFREADGAFRFSARDREKYPIALLDQLESIVNNPTM
jgi:hypothetical protein